MKAFKISGLVLSTFLVLLPSSRAQSTCFSLADNTICGPKLKGAQVSTELFTDSNVLNTYFTQAFNDPNMIAASISAGSNCTLAANNTSGFRYHLTFWCSKVIEESVVRGCEQPSGSSFTICSETCQRASDTLRQALSSSNACPTGTTNPSAVTEVFTATCNNKPSSICLDSVTEDEKYCGFRTLDAARSSCQSINDECCRNIAETALVNVSLAEPKVTVTPSATPKPSAPSSTSKTVSPYPSATSIGIAVGVCLLLLLCLFVFSGLMLKKFGKFKDEEDDEAALFDDERVPGMAPIGYKPDSAEDKRSETASSANSLKSFRNKSWNPASIYGLYTEPQERPNESTDRQLDNPIHH